jgi:signal transduction histidine kinase
MEGIRSTKEYQGVLSRIVYIIGIALIFETMTEFTRHGWSYFFYKDILETLVVGIISALLLTKKLKPSVGLSFVVYLVLSAVLVSVYPRLVMYETDHLAYFLRVQLVAVAMSFVLGVLVHRMHLVMVVLLNTAFMVLYTIWAPEYSFVELMFYLVFILGVSYLSYKLHLYFVAMSEELMLIYEQVSQQNEVLEQKNRRKDQLIKIIGHDVSAPFASISLLINFLDDKDLDEAERKEFLRRIRMANAQGRRVLKNILAWAHMQEESYRKGINCVQLKSTVEEAIAFNQDILDTKRIAVTLEWSDDLKAMSSPEAVESIIRNFISNAWKYSEEGQSIHVKGYRDEDYVFIDVIDYGVGIDEAVLQQILDRSATNSRLGTKQESGNGLGLMICFNLADMIGAKIMIKSKVGEGSTFTLRLPAC